MEPEENVHRLEGTQDQKGGLIIKKKPPTFKVPQPSLLGLDRLAAEKRKEKEDLARKMSFSIDDDDNSEGGDSQSRVHPTDRKFRGPHEETPTYTGGINEVARERILERLSASKNKEKGVYATTKHHKRDRDQDRDKDRDRHRDRERDKYKREDSSHRFKTPKFKDEPKTPNLVGKADFSKSSWDDDDDAGKK